MPDPWKGLTDESTSGGGTAPRLRSVNTFTDLKKVLPAYEEMSFTEILIELSKVGTTIHPKFYKEIQDSLLEIERVSGAPAGDVANARRVFSTIQKVVEEGIDKAGGGSGRTQFAS